MWGHDDTELAMHRHRGQPSSPIERVVSINRDAAKNVHAATGRCCSSLYSSRVRVALLVSSCAGPTAAHGDAQLEINIENRGLARAVALW